VKSKIFSMLLSGIQFSAKFSAASSLTDGLLRTFISHKISSVRRELNSKCVDERPNSMCMFI
jgi:hypothetical protein